MSNIYKKTEFKLIANLVTFYLSTAIQQKMLHIKTIVIIVLTMSLFLCSVLGKKSEMKLIFCM